MAADNNLWQQLQFSCRRINFERKGNGVNARTLLQYDFKVGVRSRRMPSTSAVSIIR